MNLGWRLRETNLPPSVSRLSKIVGSSMSPSPMGLVGLVTLRPLYMAIIRWYVQSGPCSGEHSSQLFIVWNILKLEFQSWLSYGWILEDSMTWVK